jgi:hypothetical protein
MNDNEKITEPIIDKQNAILCWLEEYKALRSEIEGRSASIRYLLILNITVIGTVLTLVFSDIGKNLLLLMIVPALAGLLGLMSYLHSRKISQIGHYIQYRIKTALVLLTNEPQILDWEDYTRKIKSGKKWVSRWASTGVVSSLTYILPSILSLIFVARDAFSSGLGWLVLWLIEIILIIFLSISLIDERIYYYANDQRSR